MQSRTESAVRVGKPTIACRYVCSALVVAPWLYWGTVTDGDAYHFLGLVLLAPLAGLVLFANSVFCLLRYRTWRSAFFSLGFVLVSGIGALAAVYFLPQFRM